jgi:hypothetical protein
MCNKGFLSSFETAIRSSHTSGSQMNRNFPTLCEMVWGKLAASSIEKTLEQLISEWANGDVIKMQKWSNELKMKDIHHIQDLKSRAQSGLVWMDFLEHIFDKDLNLAIFLNEWGTLHRSKICFVEKEECEVNFC